jgi:AraC-like DNA-binding protein
MSLPGVRRRQLSTDDPDVARAHVMAMYADHAPVLRSSDDRFHFRTDVLVADESSIGHVEYSVGVDVAVGHAGTGSPIILHQRVGDRLELRYDHDRRSTILADDDLFLVAPGHSYSVHWDRMNVTAVGLSARLLAEDAALLAGYEGGDVAFDVGRPISRAARGHWLRIQRLVAVNLARHSDNAVACRELIRLLNSAALVCFPNSTLAAESSQSSSAVPEPVRRAVAYIHHHADTPLVLADLSAEAGLSPRALQAAFRRHLDTTPLGYLRRIRLEYAHRQLLQAEPGDGQTVATIAAHWGFTQLGRFAQEHRARYGTNPAQTLRATRGTSASEFQPFPERHHRPGPEDPNHPESRS